MLSRLIKEKVMMPKNQSKKLDIEKLSDEDLQDRFTEAFEKRVGSYNNLDSFECLIKRGGSGIDILMEVTVIGMAGSPVISDFKDMKVKNSDSVTIEYEGRGSLKFKLLPEKIISLNSNDYLVVYQAV